MDNESKDILPITPDQIRINELLLRVFRLEQSLILLCEILGINAYAGDLYKEQRRDIERYIYDLQTKGH